MLSNYNEKIMHGDRYFENKNSTVSTYDDVALTYAKHIDESILQASNMKSKLPDEATIQSVLGGVAKFGGQDVPDLPVQYRLIGFSGICFRHMLNNICSISGANYLEVGTFRGSSLVSAAYGNTGILNEIHAIDNFSEFVMEETGFHPRDDVRKNLDLYLPGKQQDNIHFHEEDCFSLDLGKLPKIQVYFYDGEHSRESQTKAFTYFEPVFDDVFIAIVDDWEQRQVRLGTIDAFDKINYDIVSSRAIIPGARPGNANRVNNPDYFWWSGTYIAVLKKRKTT